MKNKLLYLLISIFILAGFYFGIEKSKIGNEEASYSNLRDAIYKSTVQCYAIEGFYPPDIKYLEDNYGLIVDHNKYVISYSVFASNIMPDIEIFSRNGDTPLVR